MILAFVALAALLHVHGLCSLLGVPGLVTFERLVPLVATVSFVQCVAAGVPVRSLVVSLRGSVPERCWIDASLGVLLELVSIELEIAYPWIFCTSVACCAGFPLFRFTAV